MAEINIRRAEKRDLPFIVKLLADDLLGAREKIEVPLLPPYERAEFIVNTIVRL